MEYDVVVIGSGAGGLTLPWRQRRRAKKYLRPGGWTCSFTLNGYRFSRGVHFTGKLDSAGTLRCIYDGLGVSQDLAFCELNPEHAGIAFGCAGGESQTAPQAGDPQRPDAQPDQPAQRLPLPSEMSAGDGRLQRNRPIYRELGNHHQTAGLLAK